MLKIALFEALNLNNNTRIIRLLRTSPNVPQGGADAPVAQLDRVAGSDPVGRGFDSLLARPEFLGNSRGTSISSMLACGCEPNERPNLFLYISA